MRLLFSFVVFVCVLFLSEPLSAQWRHNAKDQIQSLNWDIIGNVEFRMVAEDQIYPVYNGAVKRFADKSFSLQGYIVPLKNGMKHSIFMFSTLPVSQCYFCGQNGVPIMILVEMQEPIRFTFKPVKLQGILKLENTNAAERPPVILKEARLMGSD